MQVGEAVQQVARGCAGRNHLGWARRPAHGSQGADTAGVGWVGRHPPHPRQLPREAGAAAQDPRLENLGLTLVELAFLWGKLIK